MTKKNILIIIIVMVAIFTYGIAVGHYKIPPYDVLSNAKLALTNKVPEKTEARPQIYQDLTMVKDLIRINDENDITQKRTDLINYVWIDGGFPYQKMPSKVENNIQDQDFTNLKNLKQIDSITVEMEYGVNSISYLFLAENSNNKLVIYHQGHAEQSFLEDKDKIQFFLDHGYSVLIFSMVTHGANNEPVVDLPEFGRLRLNSHNHFKLIESPTFHPIKYFVEPIAVSLNYLDVQYDFASYYMMGLSGGGWITVVYPAIDPRISQSYSVAGSFPIWLRADPKNFGDYEQNLPEFYRIANYEEMYVMSSQGDNKRLVLIYNKFDPCCYSGSLYEQWNFENIIKTKLAELGKGEFIVYVDDTNDKHTISNWAMNKIINLMEMKN